MFAALVSLELHIPASGSLKAKRSVVKSLVARLRQELNCSVAEVGYQDLWQRAVLGVAVVSGTASGARKVAQQVEKVVYREPRVEVVGVHVELVTPEE
ncbi:MAG: DUF503 domain-containing protein [Euzebyales bacterium]|nr:DUF503 domain-containing protein [Euzebyaceae bacterium]MBA3622461.1 DUF503 domain-containing protein [Euzebyales bacterium]